MKKIVLYDDSHPAWDAITAAYQSMSLCEFVDYLRKNHPDVMRDDEMDADFEPMAECEEGNYLLVYCDDFTPEVAIYEKFEPKTIDQK